VRYLLGIDVGTTGAKVALFDEAGRFIDGAGQEYPLLHPAPDQVEQDPEDWWRATVAATHEVLGRHADAAGAVAGLSVSTQGGCTLLLDKESRPLGNAISWLDTRSKDFCAKWAKDPGDAFFFQRAGWSMKSCLSLTQLEWLRVNRPDDFVRAALMVGTLDYMNLRLTGRAASDSTNAAISQLMSLKTLDWSDELLAFPQMQRGKMPPIIPSGQPVGKLTVEAASELGVNRDAVVASGAHDQYCAALGAGVTEAGDCLLSCGTAWVTLAITSRLVHDPAMRVYPGPHVVPGKWGLLQSVPVAGVVLRWFREAFCEEMSYDEISRAAASVPAGAEGLLFVTAPVGGGGFHFSGAQLNHSRGHFARAIMEGIVCRIRQCLENLAAIGAPTKRLVMIGGGAKSSVWPRIVTDLTGLRTDLPEVSEAACRGAAILGGIGAGVFRDFTDAERRFIIRSRTAPTSVNARTVYEEHYRRFIEHAERLGLGSR